MKKPFSKNAQAKPKALYDEIGSKMYEDYDALKTSWPSSSPASLPAFADFMTLNDAKDLECAGMTRIGYKEFRDLHDSKKLLLVSDGRQTASPEVFALLQEGLRNILKNNKVRLSPPDRLAMTTLINLDVPDYIYACCAIVAYAGKEPPKSFQYKPAYGEGILKGFAPFDTDFMTRAYIPARERAEQEIAARPHSSMGECWRVPNSGKYAL